MHFQIYYSPFLPMPPFSALMKMHENTLQGVSFENGQKSIAVVFSKSLPVPAVNSQTFGKIVLW